MAVDLSEYTDSLRREVNPPGAATVTLADEAAVGYLVDAFWEAKLDGFLEFYTADEDGLVTPQSGLDDMPRQDVALIIIYAGIRMLRNQILGTSTGFRAKAGPVEFEQQHSATVLAEMLKQLQALKDRLLVQSQEYASKVEMLDIFSNRLFGMGTVWGAYDGTIELAGY